jgi:hypothetical protein
MSTKHTTESRAARLKEITKAMKAKDLHPTERRKLASELGGLRGAGSLARRMAGIKANAVRHGRNW